MVEAGLHAVVGVLRDAELGSTSATVAPVVVRGEVLAVHADDDVLGGGHGEDEALAAQRLEREADSLAESARMPSSCRAAATVVAVVQYSRVRSVDGDGQLAAVADDDLLAVGRPGCSGPGRPRRARRSVMSCFLRMSPTVLPKAWTVEVLPSTERVTDLSRCETPNGAGDEAWSRPRLGRCVERDE